MVVSVALKDDGTSIAGNTVVVDILLLAHSGVAHHLHATVYHFIFIFIIIFLQRPLRMPNMRCS